MPKILTEIDLKEREDQIVSLLKAGKKQNDIAKEIRCSPNIVNLIAKKHFPTIDSIILKKIIPEFIKLGIKIQFEPKEVERIQTLYKELTA